MIDQNVISCKTEKTTDEILDIRKIPFKINMFAFL